jgi:hypothetical protein
MQAARPPKPGSLPINLLRVLSLRDNPLQILSLANGDLGKTQLAQRAVDLALIERIASEHEQIDQLLSEGGGLSERTKETNSGFLRRPANSLSWSALLIG